MQKTTPIKTVSHLSRDVTAVHFVKFMNELLDFRNLDESLKENYLMDNCLIHKLKPIIRRIESRGSRVM